MVNWAFILLAFVQLSNIMTCWLQFGQFRLRTPCGVCKGGWGIIRALCSLFTAMFTQKYKEYCAILKMIMAYVLWIQILSLYAFIQVNLNPCCNQSVHFPSIIRLSNFPHFSCPPVNCFYCTYTHCFAILWLWLSNSTFIKCFKNGYTPYMVLTATAILPKTCSGIFL